MALILSIETATPVCSVALHNDQQLLGFFTLFLEKSHSEQLTVLVQNLVTQSGYQMNDLQAIAVSKGPGSYTGLRIGVSTAKGLCYALDIPFISINTLEAMAFQISKIYNEQVLFCPMIDARRMEVYCGVWDSKMNMIKETHAKIIDEGSFSELLAGQKVLFFGNGADKCKAKLAYQTNAVFIDNIVPMAPSVGALALQKYESQTFEDVAYFEPYYLKDFISTQPKKQQ